MRSLFAVLTLLLALTTLCWPNKPRKPHSPERLPIQTAIACLRSVTATQTATGISRKTVSNDDGLYVLTDLAPGNTKCVWN